MLGGRPEPVDPVVHDVDGEALDRQALADRLGEVYLVLDHEHPHRVHLRCLPAGPGASGSVLDARGFSADSQRGDHNLRP